MRQLHLPLIHDPYVDVEHLVYPQSLERVVTVCRLLQQAKDKPPRLGPRLPDWVHGQAGTIRRSYIAEHHPRDAARSRVDGQPGHTSVM